MELLKIEQINEAEFLRTKAVTVSENIFCVTTTDIKAPVLENDGDKAAVKIESI